jgi:hypothetical protein
MCWSREHPGAVSGLRSMEGICSKAGNIQERGVGGYMCWSREHPGAVSGLRSMEGICAGAGNI